MLNLIHVLHKPRSGNIEPPFIKKKMLPTAIRSQGDDGHGKDNCDSSLLQTLSPKDCTCLQLESYCMTQQDTVTDFVRKYGWEVLPHPFYSSDFDVCGRHVASIDEVYAKRA